MKVTFYGTVQLSALSAEWEDVPRISVALLAAAVPCLGPAFSNLLAVPVPAYTTLLGGHGADMVTAIAVDAAGSVYVAGVTNSSDFPTAGALQGVNAGGNDIFVAKLNAAGNGLVYCTYLGGSGDDRANGIAVDAAGSVYITGSTTSPNFPLRNPLQPKLGGPRNAFVLKLNAAGNGLLYSTYLGGNGSDTGYGIAVDSGGSAYIAGDTTSSNFPATGLQRTNAGGQDVFLAKVSSDGSRLLYSTYLGGGNDDHGAALAVDASGTAYITGSTFSVDFPVTNAFQRSNAGGQDVFVARLRADGGSLLFSTYLGGRGGTAGYPEAGQAITLDSSGNAYITGITSSVDFPSLNPLQQSLRGISDAFVSKWNSSGTLLYSTYLGGLGVEVGTSIAVDSTGAAHIGGYSYSTDLPVTPDALQNTNAGSYDAFLAKLNPAGNGLAYLSYLGGNGSDTATALTLDSSANIYLAGWTLSTNFPVLNAYQSINLGNYGGFIAKWSGAAAPAAVSVAPSAGSGVSQTFSFQFSHPLSAANFATVWVWFNATFASNSANSCLLYYSRPANTVYLLNDAANLWISATPGSNTSVQNSQCALSAASASVSLSGSVLTVNLPLTFTAAFNGLKNIYMFGADAMGGSSGWQTRGSWTVPAVAVTTVTADSVTPSSGSGSSQTFALQFTNTAGSASFSTVWAWFSPTFAANSANSCMLYYSRPANTIYFLNDAATQWVSATPGSNATLQNSQCSLNAAAASVSLNGNTLVLSLPLTFAHAYNGLKNVYLFGADNGGVNSGWQTRGSWTVPAVAVTTVTADSVAPNSGSGNSQTFALQYTDTAGAASLSTVWVWFNATLAGSAANSCLLYYARTSNTIYLLDDAGAQWMPAVVGSGTALQNSQCSLNMAGASVSLNGNTLVLTLPVAFAHSYGGLKNVYMFAADVSTISSGWQTRGSWTVT